jgi:hypothetical protein
MENTRSTGRRTSAAAPGGAVYGLGLIGSLVWFWQQADSFWEFLLAFLQAIVWPALLVYDAFRALHG